MSDRIEIPAGGGDEIHVFGLGLSGPEAEAFLRKPEGENGAGWPLKVALGASRLEAGHVEHVQVSDLAGIGLAGYLVEGHGAEAEAVEAERDRLAALRGDVLILRPSAFGGEAQTLTVVPPLTYAGAFPETRGATTMERLHSTSAEGQVMPESRPVAGPTPKPLKWLAAIAAVIAVVGVLVLLTGGFR